MRVAHITIGAVALLNAAIASLWSSSSGVINTIVCAYRLSVGRAAGSHGAAADVWEWVMVPVLLAETLYRALLAGGVGAYLANGNVLRLCLLHFVSHALASRLEHS
jgi:hypothetical protein